LISYSIVNRSELKNEGLIEHILRHVTESFPSGVLHALRILEKYCALRLCVPLTAVNYIHQKALQNKKTVLMNFDNTILLLRLILFFLYLQSDLVSERLVRLMSMRTFRPSVFSVENGDF